MKNSIFKQPKISIFFILSIIFFLSGCKIIDSEKNQFKDASPLELANLIFDDEEFQELRVLENKQMYNLFISSTNSEESKKRDDKLLFYSKSKINTLEERNDFSTALGFDNFTELIKYSKLLADLDGKYKISEIDYKNRFELSSLLFKKQIEFAFDENNINSFQSLSKSSENARTTNTCMFCSYDYMACQQGYPVGHVLHMFNLKKKYNNQHILLATTTWTSSMTWYSGPPSTPIYGQYQINITTTTTDTYTYQIHDLETTIKTYKPTPPASMCYNSLQNCMKMNYPTCY